MRGPLALTASILPSTVRRNSPPLALLLPALVIGAALLLPPVYLAVRALGAGDELWDLLFRQRVAAILGRTLLLVVSVSAASGDRGAALGVADCPDRHALETALDGTRLASLGNSQLRGRFHRSRGPWSARNAAGRTGGASRHRAIAKHLWLCRIILDPDSAELSLRLSDRQSSTSEIGPCFGGVSPRPGTGACRHILQSDRAPFCVPQLAQERCWWACTR